MLDKWFVIIFSHVFAFSQLLGNALKTQLTHQWIRLLMENPMMYRIASNYGRSRINTWSCLAAGADNNITAMNASF